MKAITIKAPHGSFVAEGVKTIETRGRPHPWRSAIGQTIAIHQGKQWAPDWLRWLAVDDWRCEALDNINARLDEDVNGSLYYRPVRRSLPLGAVVATCTLTDVVPMEEPLDAMTRSEHGGRAFAVDEYLTLYESGSGRAVNGQLPFGDFAVGRWALLLDNIVKLPEPIPARGFQGLWNWDEYPENPPPANRLEAEQRLDRAAETWLIARHTNEWYLGEATSAEWDAAYAAVDAGWQP